MSKKNKRNQSPPLKTSPQLHRNENGERRLKTTLAIICAAFAFLLYANSIGNQYTLDDYSAIKENRFTQQGTKAIPTLLSTSYRAGYWNAADELYRPLSLVMFAIEWEFSPDNPQLYHFINVLMYALTALMLFLTLCRIMKKYNVLFPLLVTLLYIAHPVHTEVVASIKSRDEIMSFFFGIVSLWFIFGSPETPSPFKLLLAGAAYFLSLFSKESTITFLFIVPLTIYFFSGVTLKKNLILSLVYWIPAVLYMIIRIKILHGIAGAKSDAIAFIDNIIPHAASFAEAKATAFMVLGKYLRLLFFPHPLVYDYSYAGTSFASPGEILVIFSFLIHIAAGVYALMRIKQKDPAAYGILFYFATISLVSNLLLLIGANMAERFLYLPSLGFCFVIAFFLLKAFKSDSIRKFSSVSQLWTSNSKLFLVLLPILVLYSFKTIQRNPDWYDNYTLYSKDIVTSPQSARIKYNLGLAIVKEKVPQAKDPLEKDKLLKQGIDVLEQAIQKYSSYADAYDELGVAYYHKQDYNKAIENYNTALKLNPNSQNAYNNMGSALFAMTRYDEAITSYLKAIELDPNYADAHMNLGSAYGMKKEYDAAISSFLKSLELRPNNIPTLRFLAMTYEFKGDQPSAQSYYRKIQEIEGKK